jgi:hypothetical protein
MRLIAETEPGVVEANFMWLPSWLGMNTALLQELADTIGKQLAGRVVDEDLLDELDARVIAWAKERFPELPGFDTYLDSLKHVQQK